MAPKFTSPTPAPYHRHRKAQSPGDDSAVVVVRAFSTLIKRRGGMQSGGTTTLAADGNFGDGRPAPIAPTVVSTPPTKSKRQHLDEKARAYSEFCRSRC